MAKEPTIKKAVVFVDGQCLYRGAKDAFGYIYPNYDIKKLSEKICSSKGWDLAKICFYTGVPDVQDNIFWNTFWNNKLASMGQVGIEVYSRSLRYNNEKITLPNGNVHTFLVGREKGIDIRIALDIIRLAHQKVYDVALVFSQDQDLSEVADEIRVISIEQKRWIRIASAFPVSPTYTNSRGINKTEWIKIDRQTYDTCIDPRDYRGPSQPKSNK
ncbi:MAG: NYN domain-containing protein [Candidatus Omnitrophica bacterium]|nr:NYN domain-containing protein [Candidatus Omnitrophota bacterium]